MSAVSEMAGKTGFSIDKGKNFSEWFTEVLKEAELVDQRYNVKGFIVHRPNAVVTERAMYAAFEKALEKTGHKPAWFPSVIPEENFSKETEHGKGFAPVFWVTHGQDTKLEQKLALRPTSETAVFGMYSLWIRSYNDLPLKIYHSAQVWRYETKATRPLIRDREFHWIETHNAFATAEDAEKQVLEDMQITEEVLHQQLGINFYFFKRPEWDKFPGAVETFGADTLMPDGRMMQLPSTHLLGQNFSRPFDVKFTDKEEKEHFVWQTCYGPCISRIYAALIATHGDSRGLVLPFDLAPTQIVIVPIVSQKIKAKIEDKCRELFEKLKDAYRTEADLSDQTPGSKYYYWELRGTPIRIEIGEKELRENTVTVCRRDTGQREKVNEKELDKWLSGIGEKILENLRSKADERFANCIHDASSVTEVRKVLEKGGFARTNFCSRGSEGEKCAEQLKADTDGGEVRGTLHGKDESPAPGSHCIVCKKPAKEVVYVARAY